jgi:hypothetical protein
MELKKHGGKDIRGKEIKVLEVTTRSEEEVLQDKENPGKMVSTVSSRKLPFI